MFSNTFANLFTQGSVNLGNISQNETKDYEIGLSLGQSSANEYQGKKVNFTLELAITGETSGTPEVLSSADSNSSSDVTSTNTTTSPSVLGLADTGGGVIRFVIFIIGLVMLSSGIFLTKRDCNK